MTSSVRIRCLAALIGLLLGPIPAVVAAPPEPASRPAVAVGVRVDTPPFAWRDEKTQAFRGYLKDLCYEAVDRAGFHVDPIGVTATQRAGIIDGSPVLQTDGTDSRTIVLDLLCDPTTISLARLQKLINANADAETLVFSPIVFVANGSYAWRDGFTPTLEIAVKNPESEPGFGTQTQGHLESEDCQCLPTGEASQAQSTQNNTPATPAKPSCPPLKSGYFRAAYVTGTTARFNIRQALIRDRLGLPGVNVCPEKMLSHKDMVKALCDGLVQYAFGDIDIAEFYSRSSDSFDDDSTQDVPAKQNTCKIKPADHPLSYEPYALLVSNHTPGFRPKFVAALYEMFSDQTVSGRFGTYFPDLTKSSALSILFRINSIPGMRDLKDLKDQKAVDASAN